MNITIQPSGLCCLNVGDQAMLEVAYRRLRELWPDAHIRVFTWAPDHIQRSLPGAIPVPPSGRSECFDAKVFGRLSSSAHRVGKTFRSLESSIFSHAPAMAARITRTKLKMRGRQAAADAMSMLGSTDLFVFSGAGIVTDAFAPDAIECLETLYLAKRLGARTAILGHMFGPVQNDALKSVCRRVLPKVDFISVRERMASLEFLAHCGLAAAAVPVTGDETLELVHENRAAPGNRSALGLNVRLAHYSGLSSDTLPLLFAAIRRLSHECNANLEFLPVAHHPGDDDAAVLRSLADGPAESLATSGPAAPLELTRRVAKCRIVVTGSYHAAVFALAQGIPAVGLVFSPYYAAKFRGLQDLFGAGCRYIDGTRRGWDQELHFIAAELWASAGYWEAELLQAAARQIALSRAAYRELQMIVEGKRKIAPAVSVKPVPSRVASEGV